MSLHRHCDPVTMDHIIELRKQLRETERQLNNVLDRCHALDKLIWDLRQKLLQFQRPEREPNDTDDERNC